jgi:hypothetical protein
MLAAIQGLKNKKVDVVTTSTPFFEMLSLTVGQN